MTGIRICLRSIVRSLVCSLFFVAIPVNFASLVVATTHPHVTPYAYATSLLGNGTAQYGALGKTGEFLRTEHIERNGLNLQAMGDVCVSSCVCFGGVFTLVLVVDGLELLVQAEAEPIDALMSH